MLDYDEPMELVEEGRRWLKMSFKVTT